MFQMYPMFFKIWTDMDVPHVLGIARLQKYAHLCSTIYMKQNQTKVAAKISKVVGDYSRLFLENQFLLVDRSWLQIGGVSAFLRACETRGLYSKQFILMWSIRNSSNQIQRNESPLARKDPIRVQRLYGTQPGRIIRAAIVIIKFDHQKPFRWDLI